MVQLLAVRHGETTLNAAGLLTGQLDPQLTARGREQAAALAPLLAGACEVGAGPGRPDADSRCCWKVVRGENPPGAAPRFDRGRRH